MPFTIISGVVLVLLLLVKSRMYEPFIKNKNAIIIILICSLLLIFSGFGFSVVLFFKGNALSKIDYAVAAFLLGIALTGFVAETPKDVKKKK